MDPSSECARVFVEGRVQDVGFRYNTKARAQSLYLTGYVRNLPDGRVEIVVEGPQAAITNFLAQVEQGPPGSRVERISVDRGPASQAYSIFFIK